MAADSSLQVQEQQFFNLFDFYWFEHQIFNKIKIPLPQIHKNQESITKTTQNLDFSAVQTINVRSYSDQMFLSSKQQSFVTDSPSSVLNLQTPKLQTIFSGKEVKEIEEKEPKLVNLSVKEKNRVSERRRKSKSKSLSELEFEELQGFMDLGFVFSEKDKDSRLVSIIPGLQRLGKDPDEEHDEKDEEKVGFEVAWRPYLSEAWNDLEKKRKAAAMTEAVGLIRIPALGNEVEIKDQLRFWAHSVASVVR